MKFVFSFVAVLFFSSLALANPCGYRLGHGICAADMGTFAGRTVVIDPVVEINEQFLPIISYFGAAGVLICDLLGRKHVDTIEQQLAINSRVIGLFVYTDKNGKPSLYDTDGKSSFLIKLSEINDKVLNTVVCE